ncbi:translocon-associated protein subunit alpha [Xenentodon cancila]
MFNFGSKLLLVFLLAFPCGLTLFGCSADSDFAEDVADDSDVPVDEEEDDDEEVLVEEDQMQNAGDNDDEPDEAADKLVTSHPDADTTIIFTTGEEFPANEIVRFLVGFTNKGSQAFTVQSLEASFRYPQDFQFFIQNFTALPLNAVVQPQAQASFEYSFIPRDEGVSLQLMAGRPFGLVILLNYLDSEGGVFQTAVYNQTITITEREEGLDGETMSMYVFLAGLVALMLLGMYQVLESRTRKRIPVKIEKGTTGINDVDINWIPQETLNAMNKASPKTSPRKRTKRAAGTDQ